MPGQQAAQAGVAAVLCTSNLRRLLLTRQQALQLASDRVRKITLRILRDIFRYSLFDDLDALDHLDRSRFQSFLHAQALAVRPDPSFALVA